MLVLHSFLIMQLIGLLSELDRRGCIPDDLQDSYESMRKLVMEKVAEKL